MKLSDIIKLFSGILTTAGVITLAVKLVVAYRESSNERKQILEKVITVEQKVDGMASDVRALSLEQEKTRNRVDELSRSNVNLKDYMMKNAASKGDVKELVDVIKIWDDEKKNGSPYYFYPIQ
jgi:hypothetical protein